MNKSLVASLWFLISALARVSMVESSMGIATCAGGGQSAISPGNSMSATDMRLSYPYALDMDAYGNLYIADAGLNLVIKVTPSGVASVAAGTGSFSSYREGAKADTVSLNNPIGVAVDSQGNLYISDLSTHAIRKVDSSGVITTVAGTGSPGDSGDGGPAKKAQLFYPGALAVDSNGTLYIASYYNANVRKISKNGIISTVTDKNGGTVRASGIRTDSSGNLYFSQVGRIYKLSPSGEMTVVAGGGSGKNKNGARATSISLSYPYGLSVDPAGNLIFTEIYEGDVLKVNRKGAIYTAAGGAAEPSLGDGYAATSAYLSYPTDVISDRYGNFYIADSGNKRVRKVSDIPIRLNPAVENRAENQSLRNAAIVQSYDYTIPEGAVDAGETISVIADPVPPRHPDSDIELIGEAVDITLGSGKTRFNKSVRFGLAFDSADMDARLAGRDPALVRAAYYDGTRWVQIKESFYSTGRLVFDTGHLTKFAAVVPAPAQSLNNVKVYPNPALFSEDKEIRFAGLTGDTSVKIYDVSGVLVKTLPAGTAVWDGKNEEGEDASAGVYVYVASVPSGEKITGKIGVRR